MERLVSQKIILEINHGTRYRVNIKIRKNKIYLGTLNNEMNYYLNNWNV